MIAPVQGMIAPVQRIVTVVMMTLSCAVIMTGDARAQTRETVTIRGQTQSLHVYGTRGGIPVIVSSGDGGWIHLGPHVAEVLAAKGFFVVGFDVKAYLERFTSGRTTLRPEDEPSDYKVIADFAARGTNEKPILIGVSEGAGLSVLAASDPRMKTAIAGVIGLGLPDLNELGWRWKDALIYLTHGTPTRADIQRLSDCRPRGARSAGRDSFHTGRVRAGCARSSTCWSAQRSRRGSGSSTRRIIVSATTWRSSTGACSKPSPGLPNTRRNETGAV